MRSSRLFSTLILLSVATGLWAAAGLDFGQRLEFKKGELYYTDGVTREEAIKVGEHLVKGDFFNETPKTVQLTRKGDTLIFRWVIRPEFQGDPGILNVSRLLGGEISLEVLPGMKVQTQICDDQLVTIKELETMQGRDFLGGQLFFTERVSEATAEALGNYLVREKFFGDRKKSVLIDKSEDRYQFKMVTGAGSEKDPALRRLADDIALELANNVFDGTTTETHLCDQLFNTLLVSEPSRSFGKRYPFNGGDLFVTSGITEADARKVGEFLIQEKFFDGKPKSVQLAREATTWQLRLVVQVGLENDPTYGNAVAQFRRELQEKVFAGDPTEIHLCDNFLRSLRICGAGGMQTVATRPADLFPAPRGAGSGLSVPVTTPTTTPVSPEKGE